MKLRSLSSRMALVLTPVFTTVETGALLAQDRQGLLESADVTFEDFIFRQAVATGDSATVAWVRSD